MIFIKILIVMNSMLMVKCFGIIKILEMMVIMMFMVIIKVIMMIMITMFFLLFSSAWSLMFKDHIIIMAVGNIQFTGVAVCNSIAPTHRCKF